MTGTGDAEVLLHLPALKPSRFPMSNSKTKNTNYDTEQRLRSPCFVLKPSSPHHYNGGPGAITKPAGACPGLVFYADWMAIMEVDMRL
eukprot:1146340-Pelagomonas_calceolata.AAC.2